MKILSLMFAILLVVGCGLFATGWDLGRSNPTDVVPAYAAYNFVTNRPINDSSHRAFGFRVERDEATLKPILLFSADAYRYDRIPIVRGAFYREWGDIDETFCPTDSYAISGHFTESARAEGIIKLAYDGQVIAAATFVATPQIYIIYPE